MYVGTVKLSDRLSVIGIGMYMHAIIGYRIIGKTLYRYITSIYMYIMYMYGRYMYMCMYIHVCTFMSSFDHASLPMLLTLLALEILLVLKLLVSVSSVVGSEWT